MTRVLPVNFGNNTSKNATSKEKTQTQEYPITYEQFRDNTIVGSVFGSVIMFGITACIIKKLFKFSKQTAITGGLLIGGGTLLCALFAGLNGKFKLKYLNEKQKFENPKPKAPIILPDFEPEN